MYVNSKSQLIQNIYHLEEWHQNTQNHILYLQKDVFTIRDSLWRKKNLEDFVKVFYKTTICPRNHFWVVPRLVVLYRFDCSNTPDITVTVTTSEAVGPVPSSDLCELANWVIVRHLIYITLKVNLFYFSRNHWWPIDIRRVS